jgi:hypothetical protein
MFPSSSPVTGGYLNIETLDRVLRKYPGVIGRGVPSVRVIAPPLLGCAGDNKYAGQHRQEDRSQKAARTAPSMGLGNHVTGL